jgi:hypothetical protein
MAGEYPLSPQFDYNLPEEEFVNSFDNTED